MDVEYNKQLIAKYPWLIPTNVFSGKKITQCMGEDGEEGFWPGSPTDHPEYDYEYTTFDEMPEGWRIAFGEQMCEEIHQELVKNNLVDKYRVNQIKEKYGTLRWYGSNSTEEIDKIISKYEHISAHTCIKCGAPAKWRSTGWIIPFCDECKENKLYVDNWEEITDEL